MDIRAKIADLFDKNILNDQLFVVDLEISEGKKMQVTLIIDGDSGITAQDCADVSRGLSEIIETENVFKDAYTWDVSSPGTDRPLKMFRQYPKHIGRELEVTLKDGKVCTGQLTAINEEEMVLNPKLNKKNKANKEVNDTETMTISFLHVDKAQVLISF